MTKFKRLQSLLFGSYFNFPSKLTRNAQWNFPAKDDDDTTRRFNIASDDGFILYFIKRIEKLEKSVEDLETKRYKK